MHREIHVLIPIMLDIIFLKLVLSYLFHESHYTAYCKRGAKCWELYDDLKSKSISVKENTIVSCEKIVYTI